MRPPSCCSRPAPRAAQGRVHPRRYLAATGSRPSAGWACGPVTGSGARPRPAGRSRCEKSWLAVELSGAETVIHAGRFEAAQRLELIAGLRPDVPCMSPTEYRLCATRRSAGMTCPACARPSRPGGARRTVGLADAYGSSATATARPRRGGDRHTRRRPARAGVDRQPLPGVNPGPRRRAVRRRPRCRRCSAGYLDDAEATGPARRALAHRRPGREDGEGRLRYGGRRDDVISSSGYRIGPGEVESALRSHPAVRRGRGRRPARSDRGQIVHADVVLSPAQWRPAAGPAGCGACPGNTAPSGRRARWVRRRAAPDDDGQDAAGGVAPNWPPADRFWTGRSPNRAISSCRACPVATPSGDVEPRSEGKRRTRTEVAGTAAGVLAAAFAVARDRRCGLQRGLADVRRTPADLRPPARGVRVRDALPRRRRRQRRVRR